jgi:hypothetical protein
MKTLITILMVIVFYLAIGFLFGSYFCNILNNDSTIKECVSDNYKTLMIIVSVLLWPICIYKTITAKDLTDQEYKEILSDGNKEFEELVKNFKNDESE